jgi:hypothetical protein
MAEGKDQGSSWHRFSRKLPFKMRAACRKMLLRYWVGEDVPSEPGNAHRAAENLLANWKAQA